MASKKPQLVVRLTEEWMERLPTLARRAERALGQPDVSLPDVVMMGLALLDEWLAQREAARPGEVAALAEPEPAGVEMGRPGRPRKNPPETADEPAPAPKKRGRPRKGG